FFSSRRRHTRFSRDWSSDVCSSDLSQRALLLDQLLCWERRRRGTNFHELAHHEGLHQRQHLVLGQPDLINPQSWFWDDGGTHRQILLALEQGLLEEPSLWTITATRDEMKDTFVPLIGGLVHAG